MNKKEQWNKNQKTWRGNHSTYTITKILEGGKHLTKDTQLQNDHYVGSKMQDRIERSETEVKWTIQLKISSP